MLARQSMHLWKSRRELFNGIVRQFDGMAEHAVLHSPEFRRDETARYMVQLARDTHGIEPRYDVLDKHLRNALKNGGGFCIWTEPMICIVPEYPTQNPKTRQEQFFCEEMDPKDALAQWGTFLAYTDFFQFGQATSLYEQAVLKPEVFIPTSTEKAAWVTRGEALGLLAMYRYQPVAAPHFAQKLASARDRQNDPLYRTGDLVRAVREYAESKTGKKTIPGMTFSRLYKTGQKFAEAHPQVI